MAPVRTALPSSAEPGVTSGARPLLADVPDIPLEWLVGPFAALALALIVGNALWKAHLASDKREQDRADAAEDRLRKFIDALERNNHRDKP